MLAIAIRIATLGHTGEEQEEGTPPNVQPSSVGRARNKLQNERSKLGLERRC